MPKNVRATTAVSEGCGDMRLTGLYRSSLVTVTDCVCRPADSGLTPEEQPHGNQLVFVRAGTFVRHLGSRRVVADPATVLFFNRTQPYRVSHPVPGGDRCTSVVVKDETLLEILERNGGGRPRPDRPFRADAGPVAPEVALLQRCLAQFAPYVDPLEADETALRLVASAVRAQHHAATPALSGEASRRRRAGVERARLFIVSRYREKLLLQDIARAAAYSPYHLCRIFKQQTGVSVNRYVNRLRLMAALESLDTASDLSALAHELGFSSHSHFSTAFRREFGSTPDRVRRGLTRSRVDEMRRTWWSEK
jgi:AraC family transcriptional regulator